MKIKPIAKYHIQTSEEIRRIVVALAAEYDTFPSETVSAIRDELKGLFIAGHQSDSKYHENPDAYIRAFFRPRLQYIRTVSGTDMSDATIRRLLLESGTNKK